MRGDYKEGRTTTARSIKKSPLDGKERRSSDGVNTMRR
jgi:hypothetical protein